MSRRGTRQALAAAVAACVCAAGCAFPGVTMTAANSINPVMFGPVRTLGSPAPPGGPPGTRPGTVFRHSVNFGGAVGGAGGGGQSWSTNPFADNENGSDRGNRAGADNPAWLDWKVLRATAEDPARRVEVTSMRCGGFHFFFLAGVIWSTSCDLEAVAPP